MACVRVIIYDDTPGLSFVNTFLLDNVWKTIAGTGQTADSCSRLGCSSRIAHFVRFCSHEQAAQPSLYENRELTLGILRRKVARVEWQEDRLQGKEWLAERASKKLKNNLLYTNVAGSVLRFEIDQVPLWRGNHVGVKQLVDDFAKYLYLPRVKNAQVILDAIQDGASRLTWSQDTFAYADYYDATADRYRGLEAGRRPTVQMTANSVVVKPEVAARQIEADTVPPPPPPPPITDKDGKRLPPPPPPPPQPPKLALRRFHGSVKIDATRLSRHVDLIASSVVQHLAGLLDATVTITVEIEAEIPSGAPDDVVRTVTENCRTLKFESSGFEES